jgi:hypothetical protein
VPGNSIHLCCCHPVHAWLLRELDVLEVRGHFRLQFRQTLNLPGSIVIVYFVKIDLLWAQRNVWQPPECSLRKEYEDPNENPDWPLLGRRRRQRKMQRPLTSLTCACLLMFGQNAWGLSWEDQRCHSLSSKDTGRGWAGIPVRWVPTLHEAGTHTHES